MEQRVAGLEGLRDGPEAEVNLESDSPAMQRVMASARQIARSQTTIFCAAKAEPVRGCWPVPFTPGASGAGKPFATVSCPTLSAQLLESELFGHAKGAFTGAVRDNPGRIAACEGGTLFLDEIGDLPRELQPKLLRFIQDRQYERVGDPVTRRADVRILTATNIDLEAAVKAGTFREDLLYRIKVMQIDLPPLRERPEDIRTLSERFLAEFRRGKTADWIHQRSSGGLSGLCLAGKHPRVAQRNRTCRHSLPGRTDRHGTPAGQLHAASRRSECRRPGFAGQAGRTAYSSRSGTIALAG